MLPALAVRRGKLLSGLFRLYGTVAAVVFARGLDRLVAVGFPLRRGPGNTTGRAAVGWGLRETWGMSQSMKLLTVWIVGRKLRQRPR